MTQAAKTKKVFDGRYEILSIVGRGGRSVVYHARHVSPPTGALSSEVALKVLIDQKGQGNSGERLRREALAMVSSRHRYVIRLDDFHSVGNLCYLSMEYAPEADLRRFTNKVGGKLAPKIAERFILQIAEALSFVHKAGIVHRDIKPDNLLVISEKEVRLGDFGVAVLPGEQASLDELKAGVGTLNYLAPEVLEGKPLDPRSDLYALGVSFYELLTGKNPFEHMPLAQAIEARRPHGVPSLQSLLPDISPYFAAAITQLMEYEPAKRFSSARELIQALLVNKAAQGKRVADSRIPSPEKVSTPRAVKEIPSQSSPAAAPPQEAPPVKAADDDEIAATQTISSAHKEKQPQMSGNVRETEDEVAQTVVAPPLHGMGSQTAANTDQSAQEKPISSPPHAAPDETDPTATAFIDQNTIKNLKSRSKPAAAPREKKTAPALTASMPPGRMKRIMTIGAGIGLGIILLPYLFAGSSSRAPSAARTAYQSPLPQFQGEAELSFPVLPSGVYAGTIKGLVGDKTFPLVLISREDRDELALIVGVEGWSAVVVNPRAKLGQSIPGMAVTPLRVAANGSIIEFTGQHVDGELFGYFKNVITGAQGEWRARPLISNHKQQDASPS